MEKSEYLELYRQMVLIRRLEETAAELYQKGEIGGFLHLYIGQEAVSTGIVAARQPALDVQSRVSPAAECTAIRSTGGHAQGGGR